MSDGDIHRLNHRLKNQIKKINSSREISNHNIEILNKFKEYMNSQGLTPRRISRYLSIWRIILEKEERVNPTKEARKNLYSNLKRLQVLLKNS